LTFLQAVLISFGFVLAYQLQHPSLLLINHLQLKILFRAGPSQFRQPRLDFINLIGDLFKPFPLGFLRQDKFVQPLTQGFTLLPPLQHVRLTVAAGSAGNGPTGINNLAFHGN